MADRNQASYSKIGFTVFIGAIAIALTLIYLGGIGSQRDEFRLETSYDRPVNGLAVGSPVNFRGVKIGRVSAISFIGNVYPDVDRDIDAGRIYIEMAINSRQLWDSETDEFKLRQDIQKLVEKGARASVTANGITGLARVEIDYFPDDPPLAPLGWRPRNVYVPPHLSLLDSFSVAATKAMNNFNQMDFSAVWTNVADAVESLALASENMRVMMEASKGDVDRIVGNVSETTTDLRETAAELRHNPSLLLRERRETPLKETK